jgi:hypothetical protein
LVHKRRRVQLEVIDDRVKAHTKTTPIWKIRPVNLCFVHGPSAIVGGRRMQIGEENNWRNLIQRKQPKTHVFSVHGGFQIIF